MTENRRTDDRASTSNVQQQTISPLAQCTKTAVIISFSCCVITCSLFPLVSIRNVSLSLSLAPSNRQSAKWPAIDVIVPATEKIRTIYEKQEENQLNKRRKNKNKWRYLYTRHDLDAMVAELRQPTTTRIIKRVYLIFLLRNRKKMPWKERGMSGRRNNKSGRESETLRNW